MCDMDTYDSRPDYVVVGAGTAGCVIASRLSAQPGTTVALLEAGPSRGPAAMRSPKNWPALLHSEVDWDFTSVPQEALGDRTVPYPRGRVLGGSSSINATAHLRAHRSHYDRWAAEGASGWGYEDLLPYFRRSETAPGRDARYRGVDGPMRVAPLPGLHPFMSMARQAVAERGFPLSDDLSGAGQEGAAFVDQNVVDGVRQSAADAYLRPVTGTRPNLAVMTGSRVHRLLMDDGRCTGVEFTSPGQPARRLEAAKEVVLCAGVFGSPQLLLLSGVGPADELRAHGIDVVHDLPGVGCNLHDHPASTVIFTARQALPRIPDSSTLVAALRSDPVLTSPDLQFMFVEYPFVPVAGEDTGGGFSILVQALLPHSRGRVRLASADPAAPPLIDPGFYTDERDLDVMLRGLRHAREFGRSLALSSLYKSDFQPGPTVVTAAQQTDFLRRTTHSAQHPAGTCRIGTGDRAVVDPLLRIHGLQGLRVADASVMPTPVGANINATVLAVAERAADLLVQG